MNGSCRFVEEHRRLALLRACGYLAPAIGVLTFVERFRTIGIIGTVALTIVALVLVCNSWRTLGIVVCVIGWLFALAEFVRFVLDETGMM